MAIYPKAVVKLLPLTGSDPRITVTQVVLHTAVSSADSLFGWFASPAAGGVESHFYVREDGTVEQYRDTDYQADAEYDGNDRAISIETWDNGAPSRTPWNAAQLAALVDLLRWCSTAHGIPLVQCPQERTPGVGYHSLFAQWNQSQHDCPTATRVAQIPDLLLRAKAPAAGAGLSAHVKHMLHLARMGKLKLMSAHIAHLLHIGAS